MPLPSLELLAPPPAAREHDDLAKASKIPEEDNPMRTGPNAASTNRIINEIKYKLKSKAFKETPDVCEQLKTYANDVRMMIKAWQAYRDYQNQPPNADREGWREWPSVTEVFLKEVNSVAEKIRALQLELKCELQVG
jgi:hypothetical protein